MAGNGSCPKCGMTLATDAPQGLCPACLLSMALADEKDDASDLGAGTAPPPPGIEGAGHADGNLLFGILALQMDFITRDALVAGMSAWVLAKHRPLAQILVDQGALSASRRSLLEPLVREHLARHGGDPQRSLAALSSVGPIRTDLAKVDDPEIHATLASLGTRRDGLDDSEGTHSYAVGVPSSAGSRFRVLRPYARGGLGQVSVALDEELHREVALKEIQERLAHDPENRARFEVEAKITGGLEHPGIVPVYGLGHYNDGRPFYAMRFIRGDSLKDAIDRYHEAEGPDRDPGEQAVAFRSMLGRFVDVCNAVAYAHSRGVLHRDLKPGNIMLGQYGETLVVDWGLAKVIGREDKSATAEPTLRPGPARDGASTMPGTALGTPAYMSPEQAEGRFDLLGPLSDIYSLGATLYCLLTGRAPFEDEDVGAVLRRVQRGDFAPPRRVNPTVPRPLEAICLKAMSLKPAARYDSANVLAGDIEHWLADEPVLAHRETASEGLLRRWRRNPRAVVLGASLAMAVAIGGVVGFSLWQRAEQQRRHIQSLEVANKNEQAAKSDAITNLYFNRVVLADRERMTGNVLNARRLLEECPTELRGWEWNYLGRLFKAEQQTIRGHDHEVWGVAYSPDGRLIASAGRDGTVRIWDAADSRQLRSLSHQGTAWSVAFDPTGRRLASSSGVHQGKGEVTIWEVETGKVVHTFPGRTGSFSQVKFSPDGSRIAASSGFSDRNEVVIWDARTFEATRTFDKHHGRPASSVAFSPDGRLLASATGSNDYFDVDKRPGEVLIWDEATGEVKRAYRGLPTQILRVAFSPDGRTLAASGGDGTIRFWDVETGDSLRPLTRIHGESVDDFAYSPDGTRIASSSADGTMKVWDLAGGRESLTFLGHNGPVSGVAFHPNGRTLVTSSYDRTVRVWDAASGSEAHEIGDRLDPVVAVAFSPDGRRIAGGGGRIVRVWDWGSDREPKTLTLDQPIWSVAFSPDGQLVATGGGDWRRNDRPGVVAVWNPMTGDKKLLDSHVGTAFSVAFSPDGRYLASGGGEIRTKDDVIIRDVKTWEEVPPRLAHEKGIGCVAFSPDGRLIATGGGDQIVRIWDATTHREMKKLEGHTGNIWCLAFSRDGRILATAGSGDRGVRLWDVSSGNLRLKPLLGHTQMVRGLAFSPDGQRLASASMDYTIKLWDTASGLEALTFRGHSSGVYSVAFSPDGETMASASDDRSLRIWGAIPRSAVASTGRTAR